MLSAFREGKNRLFQSKGVGLQGEGVNYIEKIPPLL